MKLRLVKQTPNDKLFEKLLNTVGAVEANDFEKFSLWKEYGSDPKVNWDDEREGTLVCIGTLNKRQVWMALQWVNVNGIPVLFYHPTSQLVDYVMVDEWMKLQCPNAYKTNGMNFYNVVHHINQMKEKEAA